MTMLTIGGKTMTEETVVKLLAAAVTADNHAVFAAVETCVSPATYRRLKSAADTLSFARDFDYSTTRRTNRRRGWGSHPALFK